MFEQPYTSVTRLFDKTGAIAANVIALMIAISVWDIISPAHKHCLKNTTTSAITS